MRDTIRYELELLLHLKDSPLCVKPKDLPPPEEYMGVPAETLRPQAKVTTDRPFGSLAQPKLEQGTRRPVVDRHGSRNGTSDGLVLGPTRSNFPSTSRPPFGETDRNDKTPRDSEFRERFQRGKMGAIGGDSDSRGRSNNFRGRDDADREGEGWNKVKPRKSFGQDGAERFTGRMGGENHRQQREDRGKERDEVDGGKDRRRTFETDGEEGDAPRRNGMTRGKTESWSRDTTAKQPVDPAERAMNRERIEKAKSWRTQDPEEKSANTRGDRGERGERGDRGDRNSDRHDRRWDRDREARQEREPEWMDEPAPEQNAARTQEDFKKFMERARGGSKAVEKPTDILDGPPGLPSFFTADPAAVKSAPAVEQRPDAFFAKFSNTAATTLGDDNTEATSAAAVKSSKFASLFSAQPAPQPAPQSTETRGYTGGYTEPSTPAVGSANGFGSAEVSHPDTEKQAFAVLLSKLKDSAKQQSTPPPNANAFSQPPLPQPLSNQSPNVTNESIRNLTHALDQKANLSSPEPPPSFGLGHSEEPRLRSVPPSRPEIMAPRPMQPPSQPPTVRNDQLLHELVAQRHNAQSQGSGRSNLADNQHSAYLMQLMQNIPDQRPIEQSMRLPPRNQRQPSMHFEPEPNVFMRGDHGLVQQRQMQPAAGFESQFRRSEGDSRMQQQQQQQQQAPPHPHILQRQHMIPPGLEHGPPLQQQIWPGPQPPPGQRQGPMIPQPQMQPGGRAPPGLPFGPGPAMGNGPLMNGLPPNMLQSGDNMPGPPRGMPPPGFFAGGPPPHGGPSFMPPPGMGGPFPGPDAFYQPAPGPYDGRGGMPPPGSAPFRR